MNLAALNNVALADPAPVASAMAPASAEYRGLLVRWSAQPPLLGRDWALRNAGGQPEATLHTSQMRRLGQGPLQLVQPGAGQTLTQLRQRLALEPGVETVEPNWVLRRQAPDDPLLSGSQAWGLGSAPGSNAQAAWQAGFTGSNSVVVAVIDEAVRTSHEDLAANIFTNSAEVPGDSRDNDGNGYVDDLHGWNFLTDSAAVDTTPNAHGTHVSGIIGAVANNNLGSSGVSPHLRLLPVPFLGEQGGTLLDAIAAIDYVTDLRQRGVNVRVINASWGGSNYSALLEESLRAAGDAGVMVVASAGNNGSDQPTYPAAYNLPNVISVGAHDSADRPAIFTNTGSWVDLSAPGVDILSTTADGGYGWMSGTSQAAPFVSGLVALMAATFPSATVSNMRDAILNGVKPSAALTGSNASGGRLDVQASLSWLAQRIPTAAPEPAPQPQLVSNPIAALKPIGGLDQVLVDPIGIGVGLGLGLAIADDVAVRIGRDFPIDRPTRPAGPMFPIHLPASLSINSMTVELGVTDPMVSSPSPGRLLGGDQSPAFLLSRLDAASVTAIADYPVHGRLAR